MTPAAANQRLPRMPPPTRTPPECAGHRAYPSRRSRQSSPRPCRVRLRVPERPRPRPRPASSTSTPLYSDGTGTVPEIAAAARANGLDFVLLTDHDTLAAARPRRGGVARRGARAGRRGGVAAPRRTTTSPSGSSGRSTTPGCRRSRSSTGSTRRAGSASSRIRSRRGPSASGASGEGMPWRDLECNGYTGLELWSFVTDSAERVEQHPRAAALHRDARPVHRPSAAPQPRAVGRDLPAPPVRRARRDRRAPGRDPDRRPRATAADGLQALVPLPAHAPARRDGR